MWRRWRGSGSADPVHRPTRSRTHLHQQQTVGTLLVADVEDFHARLLAAGSGELVGQVDLPGRPRWSVYDADADRFCCQHP